jgi:hypothetical protein
MLHTTFHVFLKKEFKIILKNEVHISEETLCPHYKDQLINLDCLCSLVVEVPDHRSRGLGSIPGATRFSEKHGVCLAS